MSLPWLVHIPPILLLLGARCGLRRLFLSPSISSYRGFFLCGDAKLEKRRKTPSFLLGALRTHLPEAEHIKACGFCLPHLQWLTPLSTSNQLLHHLGAVGWNEEAPGVQIRFRVTSELLDECLQDGQIQQNKSAAMSWCWNCRWLSDEKSASRLDTWWGWVFSPPVAFPGVRPLTSPWHGLGGPSANWT